MVLSLCRRSDNVIVKTTCRAEAPSADNHVHRFTGAIGLVPAFEIDIRKPRPSFPSRCLSQVPAHSKLDGDCSPERLDEVGGKERTELCSP